MSSWKLWAGIAVLGGVAVALISLGDRAAREDHTRAVVQRAGTFFDELETCLFVGHPVAEWRLGAERGKLRGEQWPEWWERCAERALDRFREASIHHPDPVQRFDDALAHFRFSGDPTGAHPVATRPTPAELCNGAWLLRLEYDRLRAAADMAPSSRSAAPDCELASRADNTAIQAVPEPPDGAMIVRHEDGTLSATPRDGHTVYLFTPATGTWLPVPLPERAIVRSLAPSAGAPLVAVAGNPQSVAVWRDAAWRVVGFLDRDMYARYLNMSERGPLVVLWRTDPERYGIAAPRTPEGPFDPAVEFVGERGYCQFHTHQRGAVTGVCSHDRGDQASALVAYHWSVGARATSSQELAPSSDSSRYPLTCASREIVWAARPESHETPLFVSVDAGQHFERVGAMPRGGTLVCHERALTWLGEGPDGRDVWSMNCDPDACRAPALLAGRMPMISTDGTVLAMVSERSRALVLERTDDGWQARHLTDFQPAPSRYWHLGERVLH